jgi:hypothetical protein
VSRRTQASIAGWTYHLAEETTAKPTRNLERGERSRLQLDQMFSGKLRKQANAHRCMLGPYLYEEQHLVECFINKMNWYHRILSRFDKLTNRFLGCSSFVAALIWLS